MAAKDGRKTAYHHGDLRSVLLEAAVELIGERGLDRLSLRECARRAGVSHAAPYRHFEDKAALLRAIAAEGFDRLAAAGAEAMAGHDAPRERLDAYGQAYVRFAFAHPEHFRLMFASPLASFEGKEADDPDAAGAFSLLVDVASEVAGTDVDPQLAAFSAWSLSHGMAMLILDDRVPEAYVANAEAVDALAAQVFALWRGALR